MDAHPGKAPEPARVVEALRSAAAASEGRMALRPGIGDRAMDAWEVPVPEHVRAIAREVGGFDTLDPHGRPRKEFTLEHRDNRDPGGSYHSRCGEPGTFRIAHTNGAAEAYYADVDPGTGEWNGVFSLWDGLDARFEAPSLAHWLLALADGARAAADAVRAGRFDDFDDAFGRWFWNGLPGGDDRRNPPRATVVDAPSARASADPVLAGAAARLPDSASIADLRGVTRRTYVTTIAHSDMDLDAAFRRFHGGRILAAVPWDC
ncbi:hypothetical protein [Actinorugispora endophytica]|uniref:Uncharacterized protein n=1 Tax=Actinorugispora endophytica TaxID=1605990 RepID=A0A4R6V1L4_9ACTN|nr:hypothetical protein [Actinorugispora endophytica]TDQ53773.1 hypothetical protein EV190_103224 [Actinorugispora endophytica]